MTQLNADTQYMIVEIKELVSGYAFEDVHAALVNVYTHMIQQCALNREVASSLVSGICTDMLQSVQDNWRDRK